jgi:hypothetical protein
MINKMGIDKNSLKRIIKTNILLIVFIVILNVYIFAAHDSAGTKGFQFLKIGVGARQAALGDAVCTLPDFNSVFINPAAMKGLKSSGISVSHNRWVADISEESIAAVCSLETQSIGLGFLYLHMDEMEGFDIDSEGEPLKISDFTASDICCVIAYSMNGDAFSTGISVKLIQERIQSVQALGALVDLGCYADILESVSLSGAVQNIGVSTDFIDEHVTAPLNFKLGGALRMSYRPVLILFDIEKPSDGDFSWSLGQEHWIRDILAIRLGYKFNSRNDVLGIISGMRAGFGVSFRDVGVDYAYAGYGELGHTHRVSLFIKFSSLENNSPF